MSRPLVSIVMASYERCHLLSRSLQCYETSKGIDPQADMEIVVVDDHSVDNTREHVLEWSKRTKIKAVVMTVGPKPDTWVDCGWVLNAGIRASSGRHILLTHPEVMPGQRSVVECVHQLEVYEGLRACGKDGIGLYACCKVYYLSPRDQGLLDTVNWYSEGALAVRGIEGFYDQDDNGNPDYRHNVTDRVATPGFRIQEWSSWVFGGCSRETWKRLGGFLETTKWGSCDISWHARRRTLGIPNHTCPDDDTIVVHQCHDGPGNVPTPRDMDVWVKELQGFDLQSPSKLTYPATDFLGWGG